MSTFDLTPLFRSTVGFDRMMSLLDAAGRTDEQAYPPYNIEKVGEDAYRVTMAVAGFGEEDLSIVAQGNSLVISGKQKREEKTADYLYRGIAGRAFERRFQLADHIKVTGAELANGILHVDLVREVPEARKPRTIKGAKDIGSFLDDVYSRDMKHTLEFGVVDGKHLAFVEGCSYPDGTHVIASATAELGPSGIVKQTIVQAWDS